MTSGLGLGGPLARYPLRIARERPHYHPQRPAAQPEGHRRRAAAARCRGPDRAERLGQVVARLRHAVRRRPAPLRRIAVHVRQAVPRPDGEAAGRLGSRASAPRSRSSRRIRRRPAARPSAPRPKSTTTCDCSGPAPAARTARSATAACSRTPCSRSPMPCSRCRERTRVMVTFPLPRSARVFARALSSRTCARSASSACSPTATCSISMSRMHGYPERLGLDCAARRRTARHRRPAGRRLPDVKERLADSVGTAFTEGEGEVIVIDAGRDARIRFSDALPLPGSSGIKFLEPTPRLFSFNNPYGSCPDVHRLRRNARIRRVADCAEPEPLAEGRRGRSVGEAALQQRRARSCSRFAKKRRSRSTSAVAANCPRSSARTSSTARRAFRA